MKTALTLFGLLLLGYIAYIRVAPSNPLIWHVDPLEAEKPRKPNAFLWRPGEGKFPVPEFDMDALSLARAFDALVTKGSNVTQLAGAPEQLFVTYIARTKVMQYPDYVSIRFIDLDGGRSTLAVFSRARFGYGDRGVNRKRVLGWMKAQGAG